MTQHRGSPSHMADTYEDKKKCRSHGQTFMIIHKGRSSRVEDAQNTERIWVVILVRFRPCLSVACSKARLTLSCQGLVAGKREHDERSAGAAFFYLLCSTELSKVSWASTRPSLCLDHETSGAMRGEEGACVIVNNFKFLRSGHILRPLHAPLPSPSHPNRRSC